MCLLTGAEQRDWLSMAREAAEYFPVLHLPTSNFAGIKLQFLNSASRQFQGAPEPILHHGTGPSKQAVHN